MKIKCLNLYSGFGGNRYKWDEVHNDLQITAVEIDPKIAKLYQERFPNDIVIIADAHEYLLKHFSEYDFIWSSPPCPNNSRSRFWRAATAAKYVYPDLRLYEEVLFLKHYFENNYVIENVVPYYDPLIPGQKIGRHLFWSSFKLSSMTEYRKFKITSTKKEIQELCKFHDYDFTQYEGEQRIDKIGRNTIDYVLGEEIFKRAVEVIKGNNIEQLGLFNQ